RVGGRLLHQAPAPAAADVGFLELSRLPGPDPALAGGVAGASGLLAEPSGRQAQEAARVEPPARRGDLQPGAWVRGPSLQGSGRRGPEAPSKGRQVRSLLERDR